MSDVLTDKQFSRILRGRIRRNREGANFTKKEIAKLLGMTEDAYKKVEVRNSGGLPAAKIEKFCICTHTTPDLLYTHDLDKYDLAELTESDQDLLTVA